MQVGDGGARESEAAGHTGRQCASADQEGHDRARHNLYSKDVNNPKQGCLASWCSGNRGGVVTRSCYVFRGVYSQSRVMEWCIEVSSHCDVPEWNVACHHHGYNKDYKPSVLITYWRAGKRVCAPYISLIRRWYERRLFMLGTFCHISDTKNHLKKTISNEFGSGLSDYNVVGTSEGHTISAVRFPSIHCASRTSHFKYA